MEGVFDEFGEDLLHIVIETNGSLPINWVESWRKPDRYHDNNCVIFSLDYKLPSTGFTERMILDNYSMLRSGDCVKFVCQDGEDIAAAVHFLTTTPLSYFCPIYFHSVGGLPTKELAETLLNTPSLSTYDVRLGVQIHKLLWGNERGK
jgi:7-carboxy-7-deazaguanine synthase